MSNTILATVFTANQDKNLITLTESLLNNRDVIVHCNRVPIHHIQNNSDTVIDSVTQVVVEGDWIRISFMHTEQARYIPRYAVAVVRPTLWAIAH